MKRIILLLALIIFVGVMALQYTYDSQKNYFSEKESFVALPPGKVLKILSFGYQNIVADMLFIWSIQFYSTYTITNSYEYIEHIFNTITDINPKFSEAYLVGSWIMALEKRDIEMAIRLLEKGSFNFPERVDFDMEIAYYAFQNLKDYSRAERYFQRAAAKPNAPDYLKRRVAHMIYLQDRLDLAWEMWLEIYQNAKTIIEIDAARKHLYDIKYQIDKEYIEKVIREFKTKYNTFPRNLAELKQKGFIREIPQDFDKQDYIYIPQKGSIDSKRKFRWKK